MAKGESIKSTSGYSGNYSAGMHEKPVFHYVIILLVIATLVVSILALVNTYQLKSAIIPKIIDAELFLKKLTAHAEMKAYVGAAPLNIVQINGNNLANLQSQISGLDQSYVGNFIIQYTDRIIVYDYNNDKIKGSVSLQQAQQGQLPADFYTKLNKHAELQGLQSEQPVGGQFDQKSLETLKQQFPDIYKDAKVGDFLLRYKTILIIYDYSADRIVNAVNLG
ncbi:MAG TPA: hypothetical protein VJJ52_03950 [Candidatus Nanoarchaeia archaeon]|nr:hypothetical protein [Candidatus Nanoarchaeia archaeon]